MTVVRKVDVRQLAQILLLSPRTGQPMRFSSPMKANPDGTFSFDVESPDGERYRITARVEELPPRTERMQ
jgi:hypothetical protein